MTKDELIHYRDQYQGIYLAHSRKIKRFSIPSVLLLLSGITVFFTGAGIYGGNKEKGFYVFLIIALILLVLGLFFLAFWIYHAAICSVNKKHRDELSHELNHITMQHLEKSEKVFPYIN